MDKIVGKKIVGIILLCVASLLRADISLRLLDQRNKPLKQAMVGQPFRVDVTIENEGQSKRKPTLKGLEDMEIITRETRLQTVNGKSSISYVYTVRIDEAGTYDLGPAEFEDQHGSLLNSNALSFSVIEEQRAQKNGAETEMPVFVRLNVDKQRAVMGEKICARLQIYCRDDSIKISDVRLPEWAGFGISSFTKEPQITQVKVSNVPYHCVTWRWDIFPKKAGPITVPAVAVDFKIPIDEEDDSFGRFSLFFGRRYQQKRVYSNGVTIQADPLPDHDGPVNAIGTFAQFAARLTPAVVKEGEGMVLSLSLEGSADFAAIETPPLIGLPDSLKYYDSKSYVEEGVGSRQKKSFEYIVQGMKPGSWEIPKQRFVYFDVNEKIYKTIETQPLDVTVLAQSAHPKPSGSASENSIDQQKTSIDGLDILPIDISHVWYSRRERAVPGGYFAFLLLIPLLIALGALLKKGIIIYRDKNAGSGTATRKNAFVRANASFSSAHARHAATQLYPIFITLLSDRCSISQNDISAESIEKVLKLKGLNEQQLREWQKFYTRISELVFFRGVSSSQADELLFDQAAYWLETFKRYL